MARVRTASPGLLQQQQTLCKRHLCALWLPQRPQVGDWGAPVTPAHTTKETGAPPCWIGCMPLLTIIIITCVSSGLVVRHSTGLPSCRLGHHQTNPLILLASPLPPGKTYR
jgi:hypothetical protein